MSRILRGLAAAVCACALLNSAYAGDIKGQILLTKALTKKRVALPDYQLRGTPPAASATEPYSADEFSRTVVYVEDALQGNPQGITAKLVQRGARFIPEILAIPVGSTVSFPNEDPVFHNVFSLSKAKQFDFGYYPAGQTRTEKFDKPGIVQVYCHIHRDMSAAILVVPNAFYTQPAKDGSFSLSGVPAGSLHIVVWHKSAGFFKKVVQVPESGVVSVSFTIPVPSNE